MIRRMEKKESSNTPQFSPFLPSGPLTARPTPRAYLALTHAERLDPIPPLVASQTHPVGSYGTGNDGGDPQALTVLRSRGSADPDPDGLGRLASLYECIPPLPNFPERKPRPKGAASEKLPPPPLSWEEMIQSPELWTTSSHLADNQTPTSGQPSSSGSRARTTPSLTRSRILLRPPLPLVGIAGPPGSQVLCGRGSRLRVSGLPSKEPDSRSRPPHQGPLGGLESSGIVHGGRGSLRMERASSTLEVTSEARL